MSANQLSGSIPDSITTLLSLVYITMSNNLTSSVPALSRLNTPAPPCSPCPPSPLSPLCPLSPPSAMVHNNLMGSVIMLCDNKRVFRRLKTLCPPCLPSSSKPPPSSSPPSAMGNNNLTGSVPAGMGHLTALSQLSVPPPSCACPPSPLVPSAPLCTFAAMPCFLFIIYVDNTGLQCATGGWCELTQQTTSAFCQHCSFFCSNCSVQPGGCATRWVCSQVGVQPGASRIAVGVTFPTFPIPPPFHPFPPPSAPFHLRQPPLQLMSVSFQFNPSDVCASFQFNPCGGGACVSLPNGTYTCQCPLGTTIGNNGTIAPTCVLCPTCLNCQ
ncbi:unnamed protein product [Closterium sp. NIES-65]|nr:unnamed protein product [Closterium sp. NIES-65]